MAKLGDHKFGVVFELIWELLYVDTACHFACCIGYTVVHYCDFLWKERIRKSYVCWSMYANQIRTPTPKLQTFVDCPCFGFPNPSMLGIPKATLDASKLATVPRTSVDHNATTHMGQRCCWLSSWHNVGWSWMPCKTSLVGIVTQQWTILTLWWTNSLQWKDPPIFNGKIHYFDWAIFNSKMLVHQRVTSPFLWMVTIVPKW